MVGAVMLAVLLVVAVFGRWLSGDPLAPDFQHGLTELGAPLSLCSTEHDWYAALESMLDLERRHSLGRGIAEHVARHGMARSSATAWLTGLGLGEET